MMLFKDFHERQVRLVAHFFCDVRYRKIGGR